ncbi:MAG: hypothetical protein E7267_03830 [Lachnospiraceae bacterium]|nr:hypothetical protein [Lachnospiraceae bacterium]
MIPSWWSAYKIIKEQPTAFDVDKVLTELQEEKDYSYSDFESYASETDLFLDAEYDDLFYKGLERAVKIVKRGGIDARNRKDL